jgi:hypothetical protein
VKLAVTIDTEADNQWDHGRPITTKNVEFWSPFQELCERHGVVPTYLVATEITENERARELLTRWWRSEVAEVGAHLHSWTTPPFLDRPGLRYNDPEHAFASQLPDDLLREKLSTLTEQITAAFGARPSSHRAGRFGFDRRAAAYLADEGYLVDSSVTPLTSWKNCAGLHGRGGPDFTQHTPPPFLVASASEKRLIEVPVTIVVTYALLRWAPTVLRAYRSLPVRAVRKMALSRWLRPQPMWLAPDPRYQPEDVAAVWRCAEHLGLETAVMMFHSSELMPGGSPFRPDARAVRELLGCLDAFFGFVGQSGCDFSTLSGMAAGLSEDQLVVKEL